MSSFNLIVNPPSSLNFRHLCYNDSIFLVNIYFLNLSKFILETSCLFNIKYLFQDTDIKKIVKDDGKGQHQHRSHDNKLGGLFLLNKKIYILLK